MPDYSVRPMTVVEETTTAEELAMLWAAWDGRPPTFADTIHNNVLEQLNTVAPIGAVNDDSI